MSRDLTPIKSVRDNLKTYTGAALRFAVEGPFMAGFSTPESVALSALAGAELLSREEAKDVPEENVVPRPSDPGFDLAEYERGGLAALRNLLGYFDNETVERFWQNVDQVYGSRDSERARANAPWRLCTLLQRGLRLEEAEKEAA